MIKSNEKMCDCQVLVRKNLKPKIINQIYFHTNTHKETNHLN